MFKIVVFNSGKKGNSLKKYFDKENDFNLIKIKNN